MNTPKEVTRRLWLKGCASATAMGALSLVGGRFAAADEYAPKKASKSTVKYQDHPYDGKMCGMCKFFVRTGGMMSDGTCQVVEGRISPMGYCILYTPA